MNFMVDISFVSCDYVCFLPSKFLCFLSFGTGWSHCRLRHRLLYMQKYREARKGTPSGRSCSCKTHQKSILCEWAPRKSWKWKRCKKLRKPPRFMQVSGGSGSTALRLRWKWGSRAQKRKRTYKRYCWPYCASSRRRCHRLEVIVRSKDWNEAFDH